MAKVLVDDEDEGQIPFLRGILTRSLRDAGLSFDSAYEVADQVRQQLADTSEITVTALRQVVIDQLTQSYPESVEHYLARRSGSAKITIQQPDGSTTPFSPDDHQRVLETIGLTDKQASDIVARVVQQLASSDTPVDLEVLDKCTTQEIRNDKSLSEPASRRYHVWQSFLRRDVPLIVLIGGTTGSGKSTIATALATQLDIVRTQSTDMLREVMRSMVSADDEPVLHLSSYNAWEAMTPNGKRGDKDRIEEGYRAQAALLSTANEAVIERACRERVSLILEGVHIRPASLGHFYRSDATVAPFMLAVLKKKELQRRISGRSKQAPGRSIDPHDKHLNRIWRLQSSLLDEADDASVPIVINDDSDRAVREIIQGIIERLSTVDSDAA